MGRRWGGDGGSRRAGSGLGKGLQRHFPSGLKEGKGMDEDVALKEVGRQLGTWRHVGEEGERRTSREGWRLIIEAFES